MAYVYLAIAILGEITFALSMKASNGFTVFWPSVGVAVGAVIGLFFLTLALKTLPVSVGYPVWVGVGTIGTVLLGAVLFAESLSLAKMAAVGAIAVGVIGLKVAG